MTVEELRGNAMLSSTATNHVLPVQKSKGTFEHSVKMSTLFRVFESHRGDFAKPLDHFFHHSESQLAKKES